MKAGPLVSVVIPARDEESMITGCLDAIATQDLPHELIEVLVVDGGSTDRTATLAEEALAGGNWHRWAVLHNPAGDRSSNLNCGLDHARAPYLCRVDARSRIPANYVRRCVELLEERPGAAVVGGRQRAWVPDAGVVATGIARALNNRWGMGLARYRRTSASGESDTVYLGAYRTEQVRARRGWSADLLVNEDFDLNRRLRRVGAVWVDGALNVDYVPRGSLGALAGQYWSFGVAKARYWRSTGDRPRPRQLVVLALPVAGLLGWFIVTVGLGVPVAWSAGVAGALGLFVEMKGTQGPAGTVAAHIIALVGLGCVAGGWLGGVVAGYLLPLPPSATLLTTRQEGFA